jgi:Ca2+-binding RTX toxin-like protein
MPLKKFYGFDVDLSDKSNSTFSLSWEMTSEDATAMTTADRSATTEWGVVKTTDFEGRPTYGFEESRGYGGMSYIVLGGDGNDQIFGGPNDDIIMGGGGLDQLYGEGGNDELYGGELNDWLFGGDGRDHLFGEGSDDTLYGEDGNDELYGGDSSDFLDGGSGEDLLVGGADSDWLTGGSGYDEFRFVLENNWYEPHSASFNPDVITDFSSFDDLIVLEGAQLEVLPANYVSDTIAHGAGYDAAEAHAMSLLSGDKTYAFVTDGVDGYLFAEPWQGAYPAIETLGVVLEGLTSVSDFAFHDLLVQ